MPAGAGQRLPVTPGPSGAAPRFKGAAPHRGRRVLFWEPVPLGFPCETKGAFLRIPVWYPASDGDGGRRAGARPVLPLNGDLRQGHLQSRLLLLVLRRSLPVAGAEGLRDDSRAAAAPPRVRAERSPALSELTSRARNRSAERSRCALATPSVCAGSAVSARRGWVGVDGHQTSAVQPMSCSQLQSSAESGSEQPSSITQVLPRISLKSSPGCGRAQGHLCLLSRAPFPPPKCLLFP